MDIAITTKEMLINDFLHKNLFFNCSVNYCFCLFSILMELCY